MIDPATAVQTRSSGKGKAEERASMSAVDWQAGKITDEGLAHMRAHLGIRRKVRPWNAEVTRDSVWHFAQGIGDDNPLWWDKAYAERSAWARMIVPPAYLYSCFSGGKLPDDNVPSGADGFLPGVFGVQASDRWIWHRPLFVGEEVETYQELHDVVVHENGKFGGRSVSHVERTTFYGGEGDLIAEMFFTRKRFERGQARDRGAYADRPEPKYTHEDRLRFAAQYEAEPGQRRGGVPRYVEDVKPGDAMGRLLKGPLTITNVVGWMLGWGSPMCPTNRLAHQYIKRNPGSVLFNPETGIEDTLEAGHWDPYFASMSGFPAGYDFGCQRVAWLSHLLTEWAGDDSFVTEMDARLRRPNFMGDVTWITGTVIAVEAGSPHGHAVCEIEAVNQRGETTATATARIRLPSRAAKR